MSLTTRFRIVSVPIGLALFGGIFAEYGYEQTGKEIFLWLAKASVWLFCTATLALGLYLAYVIWRDHKRVTAS